MKLFFLNTFNLLIIFFSVVLLYQFCNYASRDITQYFYYFDEILRIKGLGLNFNNFYFFNSTNHTNFDLNVRSFEVGSAFLVWQFLYFFSNFNTFYIIGSISLIVKFYLFNKYLHYPRLAFLIYLLVFAYSFEANQLRQAIGLNFIFYLLLTKKNTLIKDSIIIFIGTLFHSSVIIFLYFHCYTFLSYLKIQSSSSFILTFIITSVLILISYILILDLNIFSLKYYFSPIPVNILSYLFLIQFLFIFFLLFDFEYMSYVQKKSILFLCIGVVIYLVFNEYSTIASRFKEISLMAAFPIIFSYKLKATLNWVCAYILFLVYCSYYVYVLLVLLINKPFTENMLLYKQGVYF